MSPSVKTLPSGAVSVSHRERIALRLALDRWLHSAGAEGFPPRAMALRDALFLDDLGALAFRDVLLVSDDQTERRVRDVLVTGVVFEFEGARWQPLHWHAEAEDDGEVVAWLLCRELTSAG